MTISEFKNGKGGHFKWLQILNFNDVFKGSKSTHLKAKKYYYSKMWQYSENHLIES